MKRPNILLVDDQIANLVSLEQVLQELDVDILKANSAEDALTIFLKKNIDCALVDVSMPGMDGFDFLKTINRDPVYRVTPVILVTGKVFSENEALRGYQLGAVDYLYKPLDPKIVSRKVEFYIQHVLRFRQVEHIAKKLEDLENTVITPVQQMLDTHQLEPPDHQKMTNVIKQLRELRELWKGIGNA